MIKGLNWFLNKCCRNSKSTFLIPKLHLNCYIFYLFRNLHLSCARELSIVVARVTCLCLGRAITLPVRIPKCTAHTVPISSQFHVVSCHRKARGRFRINKILIWYFLVFEKSRPYYFWYNKQAIQVWIVLHNYSIRRSCRVK